jgi:hypothetical protein
MGARVLLSACRTAVGTIGTSLDQNTPNGGFNQQRYFKPTG